MESPLPDPANALSWSTLVTVALGSSVFATLASKLLDRSGSRTETVRAGYADAVKALNAWGQFPLRIRRRVDDTPQTLIRLEALGAQIQENMAYSSGWVSAESAEIGQVFNRLVELLRAEVTVHARQAWASPPAAVPSAMNLARSAPPEQADVATAGTISAEWLVVQLFSSTIQYRVGWRRYLWIRPLLRRRLLTMQIAGQAERAFAERSARRLSVYVRDEPSSDPAAGAGGVSVGSAQDHDPKAP